MKQIRLIRKDFLASGIYGELQLNDSNLVTLEHAYLTNEQMYAPKVPLGLYVCKRGPHKLHGMTDSFETFELQGVPNAWGILFHWGNYNKDSEGCILLGTYRDLSNNMIGSSRKAFVRFMDELKDEQEFELYIEEI